MRKGRGAKPVDLAELREALADGRVWGGIGVVWTPPGESAHYEISGEDVLVEVQLMPNKEPLLCRLGAGVGTSGGGFWKVPAPGTEVALLIPLGDLEQADPMIVGILSTGSVPAGLDADTLVIINPKNIVIKSTDEKIHLGGDAADTQPLALGQALTDYFGAAGTVGSLLKWLVDNITSAASGVAPTVSPPVPSIKASKVQGK